MFGPMAGTSGTHSQSKQESKQSPSVPPSCVYYPPSGFDFSHSYTEKSRLINELGDHQLTRSCSHTLVTEAQLEQPPGTTNKHKATSV